MYNKKHSVFPNFIAIFLLVISGKVIGTHKNVEFCQLNTICNQQKIVSNIHRYQCINICIYIYMNILWQHWHTHFGSLAVREMNCNGLRFCGFAVWWAGVLMARHCWCNGQRHAMGQVFAHSPSSDQLNRISVHFVLELFSKNSVCNHLIASSNGIASTTTTTIHRRHTIHTTTSRAFIGMQLSLCKSVGLRFTLAVALNEIVTPKTASERRQ